MFVRSSLLVLILFAMPVSRAAARDPAAGRHVVEGDRVSIENIAGELKVVPGTGTSVVVEVTPGGPDGDRLSVSETSREGRRVLRVEYPDDRIVYPHDGPGEGRGWSNSTFDYGGHRVRVSSRGPGLEAHADLVVSVPRGKNVSLFLAIGPASIEGVEGNLAFEGASSGVAIERVSGALRVQTGSGGIDVTRTHGTMSLSTGSGNIEIVEADGTIAAEAGSGGIRLRVGGDRLSAEAGSGAIVGSEIQFAELSAECGSGHVDLADAAADRLSVETGSGSVRLQLKRGIGALDIQAGSGSVRLEAPRDLSATFHIECPRRQLHLDFPADVERADDDVTVGRIGGGRGRIRIEAGSGRVELVRM